MIVRCPSLKTSLLSIGLLLVPVFGYFLWTLTTSPQTLSSAVDPSAAAGQEVKEDIELLPTLPLAETETMYTFEDTGSDGIDIRFAKADETAIKTAEQKPLTLAFPKDYAKPLEVKLDSERVITITDLSGKDGYLASSLSIDKPPENLSEKEKGLWKRFFDFGRDALTGKNRKADAPAQYLRYTSEDERKSLLYAFQKDGATGEKKLKHWTIYQSGTGLEKEAYQFANAKLRINEAGDAEVYYFGAKDIQNEAVKAEVDSDLMARAQRTLAKEMGEDILSGGQAPDFTVSKPYYLDRNGEKHEAVWQWNEEAEMLSVTLTPTADQYPLALDPTLSFTAPGVANGGSTILGENTNDQFGVILISADLNADGKTDLVVGANNRAPSAYGKIYIFYNDGALPSLAAGADVVIDDTVGYSRLGSKLMAGDFNFDGRVDLAATTDVYDSTSTGKVKIFYNDGSWPANDASADVTITGDGTYKDFGITLAAGDFNFDGRTDLAVGATPAYAPTLGRVYIFYNDGSIPTTAATADVTITGESGTNFGAVLAAGDFNTDGRIDLAVGATNYSTSTGRAYIFYNDGSIPTTAATADVTITGETTTNGFGSSFAVGDFNTDGRMDLGIGAYTGGSGNPGRAYIVYNDGSYPSNASSADVTITGEASTYFGVSMDASDINGDGRTDFIVGTGPYLTPVGRIYVFYNDGSMPSAASAADVVIYGATSGFGVALATGDFNADGRQDIAVNDTTLAGGRVYVFYSQNGQVNTNQSITGAATGNYFGTSFAAGDFNSDGRTDLAVGADSTTNGTVYIFYNDGSYPTAAASADVTITGETGTVFGHAISVGDFDADGRTDLAVGAYGAGSGAAGRAYIFYNDGSMPTTAVTADVTITGETFINYFGYSLVAGDFNADGKTDLAVGAYFYSTYKGRAYIFYNDGSYPSAAGSADVIITGEANSNYFGSVFASGDFNADGRTDLAVGAPSYSSSSGRAYLFYNDGSIPTTAATADVIITGETSSIFAYTMTAGDFNADGQMDLAVGAFNYSSDTGRAYLFYNDGSIPTTAATADVTITGESNSSFGIALTPGDFNADGRMDLAVDAISYSSDTGRAYIFYNDGSIPTTATTADITMTGENASDAFGSAFAAGDFNADGRTDLVVGAQSYSSGTGRVYFYETRENFTWQIQRQFGNSPRTNLNTSGQEIQINGEAGSYFGQSFATGDFNADGKVDLAVGANGYSSNTGRVYVFYATGSFTSGASSADVTITGAATSDQFGASLTAGDFNADGRTDLVVGARGYSSSTGSVYIFYNDGSYPNMAASADVTITGEGIVNYFGYAITAGDFNADGKTDLAAGAFGYTSFSFTGRAYLFYNDGSIPTTAATADVTITGNATNDTFGFSLMSGDFNSDGKTDLAVGAAGYSSNAGRAYLFYNDGSYPSGAASADVTITGNATNDYFGYAFTTGDFNTDGRMDLVVSAYGYTSSTGRAYIFYNDGSIPTTAATADVTITGNATNDSFGYALTSGDFNSDGKTDLAVGANGYSSNTGRAYIFYNDGSIPTTASTADVTLTGETTSNYFGAALIGGDFNTDGKVDLIVGAYGYSSNTGRTYIYTFNDPVITGESSNDRFGYSLASGDFNADGRTDLAVASYRYSSDTGRAYIFYNDGSLPTTAATADVTITGQSTSYFGISLTSGDFNADGRTDLAVGAYGYSAYDFTGRAYIFYNDGSIPTTAGTADVTITGGATYNYFGYTLTSGDFNADGRTDLAVGAYGYSSNTGRAYIFYNDGSIPTTAGTADVTITGNANSDSFSSSLTSGDFNADGRTDLAVGAYGYSSNTGRAYIFYNDGSIPTTASTADVTLTGETSGNAFGYSLTSGDFNADGRTDLAVGAYGYSSDTGRAYIFYNDGSIPTTAGTADVTITGNATGDNFGNALIAGDFNADGRTDLAVSAYFYSSATGRVYIFSNDGSIPTTAAAADVTITGNGGIFGASLAAGDFNADGRTDLAVGAHYSSSNGQVYLFTSEVAGTSTPPGVMTVKGVGKLKGNMKWK